jgi:hypothetical protein
MCGFVWFLIDGLHTTYQKAGDRVKVRPVWVPFLKNGALYYPEDPLCDNLKLYLYSRFSFFPFCLNYTRLNLSRPPRKSISHEDELEDLQTLKITLSC